MNTRNMVVALAVGLLGAWGPAAFAQTEQAVPTEQAAPEEQPAATEQAIGQPAAVEVGNTICPVSKEKVGEMGEAVKYEYNGKIYNLCCPMCKKDFAKDPEKFAKIAEDEVAASQVTK